MSYEYENMRRVVYHMKDEGEAQFVPVCPKCGRFVKADAKIKIKQIQEGEPNATCSRCGRVAMPSEGIF